MSTEIATTDDVSTSEWIGIPEWPSGRIGIYVRRSMVERVSLGFEPKTGSIGVTVKNGPWGFGGTGIGDGSDTHYFGIFGKTEELRALAKTYGITVEDPAQTKTEAA